MDGWCVNLTFFFIRFSPYLRVLKTCKLGFIQLDDLKIGKQSGVLLVIKDLFMVHEAQTNILNVDLSLCLRLRFLLVQSYLQIDIVDYYLQSHIYVFLLSIFPCLVFHCFSYFLFCLVSVWCLGLPFHVF